MWNNSTRKCKCLYGTIDTKMNGQGTAQVNVVKTVCVYKQYTDCKEGYWEVGTTNGKFVIDQKGDKKKHKKTAWPNPQARQCIEECQERESHDGHKYLGAQMAKGAAGECSCIRKKNKKT